MPFNHRLPTTTESSACSGWRLWVDRGGGYRLLAQPQVSIGGPGEPQQADIVVRGPWPRRAATLYRLLDGDWLRSGDWLKNDGAQPADAGQPLAADETLIWKGGNMKRLTCDQRAGAEAETAGPCLHYHRPTPLSRSAVLRVAAPFRLVEPVDGVIWFDDSLLLGPEPHNHVQVPSLSSLGLVIYRLAIGGGAGAGAGPADNVSGSGSGNAAWWIRGRGIEATRLMVGQVWRQADWSLMMSSCSEAEVTGTSR